jgi:hypothetical protein
MQSPPLPAALAAAASDPLGGRSGEFCHLAGALFGRSRVCLL